MAEDAETTISSFAFPVENETENGISPRRDGTVLSFDSSDINHRPQDFVIVHGHRYRVSRTQINNSLLFSQSEPLPKSPMTDSSPSLRQALLEAYEIIDKQKREIDELNSRVDELERCLDMATNKSGTDNIIGRGVRTKRSSRIQISNGEDLRSSIGDDSTQLLPDLSSQAVNECSSSRQSGMRMNRKPSRVYTPLLSSDDGGNGNGSGTNTPALPTACIGPTPSPGALSRTASAPGAMRSESHGRTRKSSRESPTPVQKISGTSSSMTISNAVSQVSLPIQQSNGIVLDVASPRVNSDVKDTPSKLSARLADRKRIPPSPSTTPNNTSGPSNSLTNNSISGPLRPSSKQRPTNAQTGTGPTTPRASSVPVPGPCGSNNTSPSSVITAPTVTAMAPSLQGTSGSSVTSSDTADVLDGLNVMVTEVVDDVGDREDSPAKPKSGLFEWKDDDLTLFIVHDNPQLGVDVHNKSLYNLHTKDQLLKDTSSTIPEERDLVCDADVKENEDGNEVNMTNNTIVAEHPRIGEAFRFGLEVMLETKGSDGLVYFILSRAVYSGPINGVEGADPHFSRGGFVIAVRGIRGYRIDIKKCKRKEVNPGIFALSLDDNLPEGCVRILDTKAQLIEFLQPCIQRVDVILSPSHYGTWFPYWEEERKMAPQFRSQGVGYIRLGDDMSRFGIVFLSTDAGQTFLEPEGSSEIPDYASSVSSMTSTSTARTSIEFPLVAIRVASENSAANGELMDSQREGVVLKTLLQQLKDEQVKWSHRAQLLQQLQSSATSDPTLLPEVLNELQSNITKQKNPHVVRAAALCVPCVGDAVTGHAGCGASWRALLLDTIHLLRHANKSVSDGAKESLSAMHGRSLSLNSLTSLLDDIIAGPRARGEGTAFNTIRVVQWLCEMGDKEIAVSGLSPDVPGPGPARAFPRIDAAFALLRCRPLVLSKEEATRDSAMALMARVLALDIVQQQSGQESGSLKTVLEEQPIPTDSVEAAGDLVRRLICAASKQALEALYVTAPNAAASTTPAFGTTTSSSTTPPVDVAAQRRLARLLVETLRLLYIREGLSTTVVEGLLATKPSKQTSLSQTMPIRGSTRKGLALKDGDQLAATVGAEVLVPASRKSGAIPTTGGTASQTSKTR